MEKVTRRLERMWTGKWTCRKRLPQATAARLFIQSSREPNLTFTPELAA
jgi:hypothetical protein